MVCSASEGEKVWGFVSACKRHLHESAVIPAFVHGYLYMYIKSRYLRESKYLLCTAALTVYCDVHIVLLEVLVLVVQ